MDIENNQDLLSHIVTENLSLFDYLKTVFILSFRQTNYFMKENQLLLNGKVVKFNTDVHVGDLIQIRFTDEEHNYKPTHIPIDIVYETDDLLAINKPSGLLVYDAMDELEDTLANAISYYFEQIGLKRKIRFINRLDQDTSGVILIAKNSYAHQFVAKQFDSEQTLKVYRAVIEGKLPEKEMTIDFPIIKQGIGYITSDEGKQCETRFQVLKESTNHSLISCQLITGRTHQIRVHLKSLGTPIVGDSLYGQPSSEIARQALHASSLTFMAPRSNELTIITAPLPEDMQNLLN